MKTLFHVFILLVGCAVSSMGMAAQGVRYVCDSCSGNGLSWATPASLLAAVDDLNDPNDGGVIYMAAGTYILEESLVFDRPIQLMGAGMNVTELQNKLPIPPVEYAVGGATISILSSASGSSIRGVSLRPYFNYGDPTDSEIGAYKSSPLIGGIYVGGASDVTFSEVLIELFGASAGFVDPNNVNNQETSYGIKIETVDSNQPKNITLRNSQVRLCSNGIVALEVASLNLNEVIVRDNKIGPALYAYNSTVNASNSWFALKTAGIDDYQKSQYMIYLDSDSEDTATNSQFINTETEWGQWGSIDGIAHHIYVGTSGNQFVNHMFVGGAASDICDSAPTHAAPFAIDFTSGTSGNVVGQYISTGKGCGLPYMHDDSSNKIWLAY